jgi:hypothetical protein
VECLVGTRVVSLRGSGMEDDKVLLLCRSSSRRGLKTTAECGESVWRGVARGARESANVFCVPP